ncbi:diguanylate cyclase domain-containing protein [Stappia indica]|nr:diguanylate cyclase [Stappia indica]
MQQIGTKSMGPWLDGRKRNLALAIYLVCAAVIMAFALSNTHMLGSAGGIADEVRAQDERHLVRNELDRQVEILADDQARVSHWDEAVRALVAHIDWTFVREEIANWHWEDFGIQVTVMVGPDNRPRLLIFEDDIRAEEEAEAHVALAADLVEAAREAYASARERQGSGFRISRHPVRSQDPLYVSDVREINGEINMIVAQAIVPDDDARLPDGAPNVLLTFKPLLPSIMTEIGRKLGLRDFAIRPVDAVPPDSDVIPLGRGSPRFVATWVRSHPSAVIWREALPLLLGVLVLAAIALGFVALRFARSLRRLQQSEERNRFLANHDALTGLPNRLQFEQEMERVLQRSEQDRCAVLCIDLDRFKQVNDSWGHAIGDLVIRTVSARILDVVGDRGMSARVGGDEFIVLLREGLDRSSVLALCDRIVASVCSEIVFDGGRASVGASIGVAWWPDDALTAKSVIRSADEALYRAKQDGRGRTFLAAGIAHPPVPPTPGRGADPSPAV